MSEASRSKGTLIKMGDGASPEVFSAIAEVLSIGGPNETREKIDVTHLNSPGDYREFLMSFIDPGEIPLEVNFIPGNATQDYSTGMLAAQAAGTLKNWQLVFPTSPAKTYAFAAYVQGFSLPTAVGAQLKATFTLARSGAGTWT
jgi:hypothetical protein